MKEQMSGDQADREQLLRFVEVITKAMPHFQSAMGGESDHAELALARLIEERDALREGLNEGANAVLAFEVYCQEYQQHGISPRLEKWKSHASLVLAVTNKEGK